MLKIGDSAKVVIKQDMKGGEYKYGFNNNKREKACGLRKKINLRVGVGEGEKKQSSLPPEKKSLSWSSVKKLRLVKKWYFKNACFHPLLYFFPQKVSALSFSFHCCPTSWMCCLHCSSH